MPLRVVPSAVPARLAAAGLALVLAGGLAACGEDTEAAGPGTTTSATSSSLTDAECQALLPASVAEGLGWGDPQPVVNRATSCEVQYEQGNLGVEREAGGPEDAAGAFERACDDLTAKDTYAPVELTGTSGDVEVCAASTFPASGSGTGIAEAVVQSPDDVVSTVQLSTASSTTVPAVQAALEDLVSVAAEEMPARR